MANELEGAGDTGASTEADNGFDMEAGLREMSQGLGLEVDDEPKGGEKPVVDDKAADDETAADADAGKKAAAEAGKEGGKEPVKPDAPVVRPPPKSWQKDMHEWWGKTPKEAQDYIELRERQMLDGIEQYKTDAHYAKSLRDVLSPYRPMIQAYGMEEPQAIQALLNAQYRLTSGSPETRKAAYEQLGRNLGLVEGKAGADGAALPPELQDRLDRIESTLTARQQAEVNEVRQRTAAEVEAFASNEAHPYFDEVADDIIALIKGGKSLDEAYEKAVWANPVTRQKEIARIQTEADAKRREKAKQDAEAAKRATAANMRGRETRTAPTEPKGTWDDTMRDTLKEIKERAH